MKRNSIIVEELERRVRFYQNMSTSFDKENPFDFKNLEIALAEINNICFRNCDFSNTLFQNASLTGVTFMNCNLTNANFIDSELADIRIINSPIPGVQFKDSDIESITIQDSEISETDFDNCEIYALYITGTIDRAKFSMSNCNIRVAKLSGYVSANFPNTHFDTLLTKHAEIKLKETTALSIDSLKPYHTNFYPETKVEQLKTVSGEIQPDTYETRSIANRPTFYGYSKN